VNRRELLRAVGGAAALSFVPRDAQAAWLRVASGRPPAAGLTEQQLALVGAVADTIIPRTDTPGATDVDVPAWVNVIFAEYYTEAERTSFVAGLEAIDGDAKRQGADSFVALPVDARGARLAALDRPADRQAPEARAFARLKGLVVHGYFTSERVQKEVLKVEIMPGRFDGAAPMPPRGSR
jgi:glucoside 3-dehydrogenase (cytochrome c) hitch-hiker subunit